jgi:hypothetical protein
LVGAAYRRYLLPLVLHAVFPPASQGWQDYKSMKELMDTIAQENGAVCHFLKVRKSGITKKNVRSLNLVWPL